MPKMIFVNLAVTDLARSTAFYEAVGATRNMQFSDATASCMVFSETIHIMLMTHEKFSFFSPRPIPDARQGNEVLICMSADSRAEVDAILERVAAVGGKVDYTPADDHGFMYGRNFEDPDGHVMEVMWLDVEAMKAAQAQAKASA